MMAIYRYVDNREDPPAVVLEVQTDEGIFTADAELTRTTGLVMGECAPWLGCDVELDQTRIPQA